MKNFIRLFFLILLTCSLWLTMSAPVSAETSLFNKGGWVVIGATDTGPNPRTIKTFVAGIFAGTFSELKIVRAQRDGTFPQVFSIKGSGAMRAALPNTEWGGTFYATGYWDCNAGFVQNMPITKLDIRLDPSNSKNLQLKGKASNQSFKANNFMLRLARPRIDTFAINVSYGLVATTAVCVDQTRQANHEGFRLARIASHYISSADQDNDQARYTNTLQKIVCANLQNQSGFILNNPTALGQSPLMLVHTTTHPRNTPTLALEFSAPPLGEITPQGYVMQTSDPNSDNVDLWGNWASARANYMKGEVIGSFSYMLRVTPPSILTCP